jgi:undecaprenyl-diphosphatase
MNIDVDILLWINGHYADWLDSFMWTVSRANTWIALYVLLVGLVIWRFRNWQTVFFILMAFGVAVGLSDYTCSGILKPLVCRWRPTHEPGIDPLHYVFGYRGGLYGFCSSHAANTMAVALLFCLLFRNKIATAGLMTWVALNCYSRMYLGAHYPSDIVAGLLIGASFATLAYLALRRWVLPSPDPSGWHHADDGAAQPGGS